MPLTILLDAYGTLFNTGDGSVRAAQEILSRNGREDLSPQAFYAQWKALHHRLMVELPVFHTEAQLYAMGLERLYRAYGFSRSAQEDVAVMLRCQGTRQAYPEVRSTLEHLAPRCRLCVASTTDTQPLLQDLARARLPVAQVFTSQSLGAYKPQRAFYQGILSQLGAVPQETLFVGDSLTDDVLGPRRMGMRTCWVNRKGESPLLAAPEFEISSLAGLPAVVDRLERE